MNIHQNYPYTDAMNQCGICDKRVNSARSIGFYVVGTRGGICYPLCRHCNKIAAEGLSQSKLRTLNEKWKS